MPQCINIRRVQEGSTSFTAQISTCPSGNCMDDNCGSLGVSCNNQFISKINNVTISLTVIDYSNGVVLFQIPSNTFLKAGDSIYIESCSGLMTSNTQTVSSIDASLTSTNAVSTCANTTQINLSYKEDINIFLGNAVGNTNPVVKITLDSVPITTLNTVVSTGTPTFVSDGAGNWGYLDGGNQSGNYSLAYPYTVPNVLPNVLALTNLQPDKYWTVSLGYINFINTGTGAYKYMNTFLGTTEVTIAGVTSTTNDVINLLNNGNGTYSISINSVVVYTGIITIDYTVSAGSISPASATYNTPVTWTLPTSIGNYIVYANIGTVKFGKTIAVTSCADAVDDVYTGIVNTPVAGNVANNDTDCSNYTKYKLKTGTTVHGVVHYFNELTGDFVFSPENNYFGAASFQYDIQCSNDNVTYVSVDTATVSITIDNGVANLNDKNISVPKNGTLALDLRTFSSQCTSGITTYQITTAPLNGVINSFISSTGLITYNPNTDFEGTDVMVAAIYCNNQLVDTGIITILVIDPSPCKGVSSEPVWARSKTWKCLHGRKMWLYQNINPCAVLCDHEDWRDEGACYTPFSNCQCPERPSCRCGSTVPIPHVGW